MSEIININGTTVKIGEDDGTVTTVPIASIGFSSPQIGDKVKVYKDGDGYFVKKVDGQISQPVAQPTYNQPSQSASSSSEGKEVDKNLFVWVFCFLLGGFGVDRFMRGQIGTGICKLLFGWLTFGIWSLVDWIIALVKAYGSSFGDSDKITFDSDGSYAR